jgi:ectoine hydroxylase-related dioxygenase (phytanoyl-CoA dioxygenase family)
MLTEAQVQSFHERGLLHLPRLLAADELAALRGATDRLQADAIARLDHPAYLEPARRESRHWIEHPETHYVYCEKADGAIAFRRIERMFAQDAVFVRAAVHPLLLTHVWQVLQRPFWPRGGSLVVKLPHEGAAVRWHQDIPYLYWSSGGHSNKGRPHTHPVPNFTTDLYLDESSADNGCLWAVPGSHKTGSVDIDRILAEHGEPPPGAVPLVAEPGDVMFHHVAVVHGSPENRAPTRRRTFYIHYLCDETVQDAYEDWPDLLPPDEAREFWGAALSERRNSVVEGQGALTFQAKREGLTPV